MASVLRPSHQQPRPHHNYRNAQELAHRHPIKRHRTKMDIRLTIELHKESEDAITQQEETAYLAGPPRFRRKTPDNNEKNDASKAASYNWDGCLGSGPPAGNTIAQGTSLTRPHNS